MLSYTFPLNGMRSALLPLERSLGQTRTPSAPPQRPPLTDVVETSDGIIIRIAMPGVARETIEVELEKDTLSVSARREPLAADEGALFHRSELAYGKMARTIPIPIEIDREAITASYEAGMLTVTMPKAETSKPRKIEVKTP